MPAPATPCSPPPCTSFELHGNCNNEHNNNNNNGITARYKCNVRHFLHTGWQLSFSLPLPPFFIQLLWRSANFTLPRPIIWFTQLFLFEAGLHQQQLRLRLRWLCLCLRLCDCNCLSVYYRTLPCCAPLCRRAVTLTWLAAFAVRAGLGLLCFSLCVSVSVCQCRL